MNTEIHIAPPPRGGETSYRFLAFDLDATDSGGRKVEGSILPENGVIVRHGDATDEQIEDFVQVPGVYPNATHTLLDIWHLDHGALTLRHYEGKIYVSSDLPMTEDARRFCEAWGRGMLRNHASPERLVS